MLYRLFPLTLLLLSAFALQSQTPQSISLQEGGKLGDAVKNLACADQFAGTVSFANFMGQSNDIDPDTIFLCFNDAINIVHNGNADLSGDPNPGTQPGVTYGFFDCPPMTTGPDLTTILTEPCIITNTTPPPSAGIWVTAGGNPNGNLSLNNTGTIQNFFNGGSPVLIWFAPITIDNFGNKQYENDPVTGESGPCVHLNVAEAFAVVYLNEIEPSGLNTNTGVSGCQGEFLVEGGLPEFDGSFYNFTIQLVGNPSVTGSVVGGPYTHGETVKFEVPVPGVYNIFISDGKSCDGSLLSVNMSSCVNVTQSVQDATAAVGDNICLNVTIEAGFDDIVSIQYALTWDETVLQYTNVTNLTPLLPGFNVANSFNSLGDSLIFIWGALSGVGVTLPPGTVLYQICFDVVGNDGDCTFVEFVDPEGPGIEVVNEAGSLLGFNGIAGEVCVSASALAVNFTQDSVSCPTASDGGFTVMVAGGQAPYSISWQSIPGGPIQGPAMINVNGGSFTVSNLAAGTYSVTVADSQGPPVTTTETVEVPSAPVFDIIFNENQPACNGQTGSIMAVVILDSIVVNNPGSQYTFLWSNAATTQTISNILSGSYSVTLTQTATGCTITKSTFLPQPPVLSANITVDSATCSGVGDGSLHLTVSGGTPDVNGDYTIQWPTIGAGVTIVNTMSNINGLEAGIYPLIITDDNGCVFQSDVSLPAKKILTINRIITNINCSSDCSGSIFVSGSTTSSTGQPPALPYNFDWFGTPPPPPPTNITDSTSTLMNLCIGSYTVVMEDAAGCEVDSTFSITAPPDLNASILNVTNASCQPGNDGSITVGVTGGTYPYTYDWNTADTDSIANNLAAGNYTVIVEDLLGCIDSVSATVTAPQPPTIQTLLNDTLSCPNGTNGSLTVIANPGSSPIASYNWSGGSSGNTLTGLSAGIYSVTVTDQNGCTATGSASVVAPLPVVLDSINTTPPQCPGLAGGTISVYVSGGTGPYLFEWSNNVSGVGFNVLGSITAGDYTVTVTDANGCQPPLVVDVTLDDPPAIVVNFSAIDSVSCVNAGQTCDGTATATASYNDGTSGLFDFTWQSGESDNDVTSSTAVQLCKDVQYVIVSDGICFDTFSVTIPAPLPIVPGVMIENVSCFGLSDGEITLIPSGGTPPYNIVWSGSGQTGPTISGLPAGNYSAVITDSKNCSFTHTVVMNQPSVLNVEVADSEDVSCEGDSDGFISLLVEGGNLNLGNPTFLWENGVAPNDSEIATQLSAGTYSVTVVDAKGCRDSLTHVISEPPPIQFSLGEIEPVPCFGGTTIITVDSVWGGTPSTYLFSVNGDQRPIGSPQVVPAGEYTIIVEDQINGCNADSTITIAEPQQISVLLPDIVEIELGDTLTQFDPTILPPVPIDSFIWTPGDQLSCSDCKNPFVIATESQLYTLTIIDLNGCSASAQVLVEVDRNRNVYIPNVFSANADGINDKFQVFTGIGVENINFIRIYDRWGELVFERLNLPPSPDGTDGWDGNFRGEKMKPAVFMYLVEVRFLDGKVLLYRGDVTLVR